MNTEIQTVEQRAIIALNSTQTEADLQAIKERMALITEIKNKASRDECHSLYMTAVRCGTSIREAGKSARDDANKFSKAIISEENRLVVIIESEKERLKALRDGFDEQERLIKEKEIKRIACIKEQIDAIRTLPQTALGARTSDAVKRLMDRVGQIFNDNSFDEFVDEAVIAADQATACLQTVFKDKLAEEQEREAVRAAQAKLAEEQAALLKQRQELEEQVKAIEQARKDIEALKAPLTATPDPVLPLQGSSLGQYVKELVLSQAEQPQSKAQDVAPSLACGVFKTSIEAPRQELLVTPKAEDLASAVSHVFMVGIETARDWLAERADEFKRLSKETA